jgi:hypothetical protein
MLASYAARWRENCRIDRLDAESLCSKRLSGISSAYTEPTVNNYQPPAPEAASEGRVPPVIFSDGLPNPERLLAFLACHSASNPDPVTCSAATFEWPWDFAQGERVTIGADCAPLCYRYLFRIFSRLRLPLPGSMFLS